MENRDKENTKVEIQKFVEWLCQKGVLLSYWNPKHNELLPVNYDIESLLLAYATDDIRVTGVDFSGADDVFWDLYNEMFS